MQKDPLNWKALKRMKALGVDEAAEEAFEREKKAGFVKAGMNVLFTENWVYYDSGWGTALFPLKEIEFFQKGYLHWRYSISFYVELLFKDGGKYKLSCQFEELDELAAALTEHCPQANQRPYGTYL